MTTSAMLWLEIAINGILVVITFMLVRRNRQLRQKIDAMYLRRNGRP